MRGNKRDVLRSQVALGTPITCHPISPTWPFSSTSLKVALPLASPRVRWDLMFGAGHLRREQPWEGEPLCLG